MKVKDILYEIEQLKKEVEILDNIKNKMACDESINQYMKDTFDIGYGDIARISLRISHQLNVLQNELGEYEVDIQM